MSRPSICVIPVSGQVTTKPFTGDGLDEIVAALGTHEIDKTTIDATEDWGLHAWVGDDSFSDGSPINRRATDVRDQVRREHGHGRHPYPLCGTVVLMAFDRRTGESIDLPDRWRNGPIFCVCGVAAFCPRSGHSGCLMTTAAGVIVVDHDPGQG
jgi:hypothetical protein